ncbi:MAG: TatD family hydrolase [Duncaniella sp.]|nr:TatD family hydrolase [Duncaniella sp.]
MIIDSHTHNSRPGAVVNIDPVSMPPRDIVLAGDRYYTVGIHPWNAGCYTPGDVARMRRLAARPQVVAIGETGLDSVHVSYEWVPKGKSMEIVQAVPDLQKQIELLNIHIELSETLGKPLLLHIVKRFPEIMKMRIKLKPRMPWIIHGFRGKPGLAKDLLRWGFYLSYGEKFNPESVLATPPGRMLAETDESRVPFDEILASLPVTPAVSLPHLLLPPAHCAEAPQV